MTQNTNSHAVLSVPTLEEAFSLAGIPVPETVQYDDCFKEYAPPGKRKKTLWYKADERGCVFGDVATGASFRWVKVREDGTRPLPPVWTNADDYKAHLAEREAKKDSRTQTQAAVAIAARETFGKLPPAPPDHPYLVRKGILPGPCKIDGEALVVPVYGEDGHIQTLQYIQPDGAKRFIKDGKAAGGYLELEGHRSVVLVCEGYATGWSLNKATGYTTFCAFSAGQLLAVASIARARYQAMLVYCADNDAKPDGTNPGVDAAQKAALTQPGVVCWPPSKPGEKVDFNDLFNTTNGEFRVWDIVGDATSVRSNAGTQKDAPSDPLPEPDTSTPEQSAKGSAKSGTKTARLLGYVMAENVHLWADQHGEPYISRTETDEQGAYQATFHVNSQIVKDWLGHLYFVHNKSAPSSDVLREVVNVLRGQALFDKRKAHTAVRVYEDSAGLWLDLCNNRWEVVHVTADGWAVKPGHEAPCRFVRTGILDALPTPTRGGTLDELRDVINVQDEDDLLLLQLWLANAVRSRPPYPILAFTGEAGSAKTTAGKYIKRLIDPGGEKGAPPREEEALTVMATMSHVLMLDNFSSIPGWLSDALCRVVTGGTLTKRKLYTDFDAASVYVARPVILTSIADVVSHADLQDRTMTVTLRRIPDEERRTEEDVDAAFAQKRPRLLGAILDVVAHGFKTILPKTPLPRMADFAHWAMRCEGALGKEPGTFATAFSARHRATAETAVEADDVARILVEYLETRFAYNGTYECGMATLYDDLTYRVKTVNDTKVLRYWPANARALSARVRKIAPALRKTGIQWEEKRTKKGQTFYFTRTD